MTQTCTACAYLCQLENTRNLKGVNEAQVLSVRLIQILIDEADDLASHLKGIVLAVTVLFSDLLRSALILVIQVEADDEAHDGRNEPESGHKCPRKLVSRSVLRLPKSGGRKNN